MKARRHNHFKSIEIHYDGFTKVYVLDDNGRLPRNIKTHERRNLADELNKLAPKVYPIPILPEPKLEVVMFPLEVQQHYFQLWKEKVQSQYKYIEVYDENALRYYPFDKDEKEKQLVEALKVLKPPGCISMIPKKKEQPIASLSVMDEEEKSKLITKYDGSTEP